MRHTENCIQKVWTIADAKARLSELLRLANDDPQFIGTKKAYVLITHKQWQEMNEPKEPVGRWLVEAMSGVGELELPNREDPERDIPFQ